MCDSTLYSWSNRQHNKLKSEKKKNRGGNLVNLSSFPNTNTHEMEPRHAVIDRVGITLANAYHIPIFLTKVNTATQWRKCLLKTVKRFIEGLYLKSRLQVFGMNRSSESAGKLLHYSEHAMVTLSTKHELVLSELEFYIHCIYCLRSSGHDDSTPCPILSLIVALEE